MSRTIWILILACALAVFCVASGVSIHSCIAQRHVSALGCVLMASDALLFWIGLGYLRFRLREARDEARAQAERSRAAGVGHLADVSGSGAATAANDLGPGTTPFGG